MVKNTHTNTHINIFVQYAMALVYKIICRLCRGPLKLPAELMALSNEQ